MLLFKPTQLMAQDFTLVTLAKNNNKTQDLESQYISRSSNYSGLTLQLFKNGKFSLIDHTCMSSMSSYGTWLAIGDTLILKSEIQQVLPIKVIYLNQIPDKIVKNLAIIKDLKGREYTHSAIDVNSDTISCFYGDSECFGSYKTIDSIKVTVNNITSNWVKVDRAKGIIQVTIETEIDLNNYFSVKLRFKKAKGKLRLIKD